MGEINNSQNLKITSDPNKNKRYILKDITGKKHIFTAGENGMTEDWIAQLRHDENEDRSSNFHYYYKWNGKEYVLVTLSSDSITANELEHYPSMSAPEKDAETLMIEREEREIFLRSFNDSMQSLTPNQHRLIQMRYELGLTDVEIARIEGVDPTSIRDRWEKICKKIEKFFD